MENQFVLSSEMVLQDILKENFIGPARACGDGSIGGGGGKRGW